MHRTTVLSTQALGLCVCVRAGWCGGNRGKSNLRKRPRVRVSFSISFRIQTKETRIQGGGSDGEATAHLGSKAAKGKDREGARGQVEENKHSRLSPLKQEGRKVGRSRMRAAAQSAEAARQRAGSGRSACPAQQSTAHATALSHADAGLLGHRPASLLQCLPAAVLLRRALAQVGGHCRAQLVGPPA